MGQFFDRREELRELNALLNRKRAQLVVVSGLRRQGKTSLVLHWAQAAGRPYLYWLARRETVEATRQSLARALWRWAYPQSRGEPPQFSSWEHLLEQFQDIIRNRAAEEKPLILIFDEFSDAAESDPALPSHIQALWDHELKDTATILVLAGSHIAMMEKLLAADAPLYGRATARLQLGPLPYAALEDFFPHYPAEERVALYAVLGGVPAYLEQFDPTRRLATNIRHHLLNKTGMFRTEPSSLIGDLVRETRRYEAVLGAVAKGFRTANQIADATHLYASNLTPYLKRLGELGLLERRISALIPPEKREEAIRGSAYYLRFPYLRFYYRFIDPHLEMIELGLVDTLWQRISEEYQFRAFVGQTAFEDLCREWTLLQARVGNLPFPPEIVGSHWAPDAQIDVVAINWRKKEILLGEAKWEDNNIDRAIVRKLIDKAPLVVPGDGWRTHFYWFSRVGFTAAARAEAASVQGTVVDLETLDRDLRREMQGPTRG